MSTASKAPASKTTTTASKAPASKAPKTEKAKAGGKTTSSGGDDKKKRRKARKETYSSYIYKGESTLFGVGSDGDVDEIAMCGHVSPQAGPP